MIELKRITAKNFLSYGNVPTVLDLNTARSTLVLGKNGCGKSALQSDAVTYALYGKPFRKINLPQLVNSINGKDCEVCIEFSSEGKEYKVIRGMRPSKLEIYLEGKLLDQEAATRDYQGYLEKNVLKVSHKTFTQSTILGSATFTPFMQLTPASRREIVEDILDIGVFARMNRLLKEKVSATKNELASIEADLRAAKAETVAQKKVIDILKSTKTNRIQELDDEINAIQLGLNDFKTTRKEELDKEHFTLGGEPPDVFDVLSDVKSDLSIVNKKILETEEELSRISTLSTCECCYQAVSSEHREFIYKRVEDSLRQLETEKSELENKLSVLQDQYENHQVWENALVEIRNDIERLNALIANSETRIAALETKKKTIERESSDINSETKKLSKIAERALHLLGRKSELVQESDVQQVSLQLLKDSGIKSTIVQKYLPILNHFINKYLAEFDFFVNFQLDENFSEEIRSRGRDVFSYANFSEGEKKRIDIAILLAFRQIASMKNSAKINVLLTDEVDGGLDQVSLEKFVDIMTNLPETNSFIISHALVDNPSINTSFDSVMQVSKVGDFSVVTRT